MENRFADRVEWELTRACDLRCRHCYSRPGRARRRELDTDEALAVASTLGRLGCRAVTLSGGEPLLRADWPQLAQALSRAGVIVQLVSNGQRFGRLEARLARAAGVGAVHLSLDGLAGTHDGIRRTDGAFQRLTRAADELTDAGIPPGRRRPRAPPRPPGGRLPRLPPRRPVPGRVPRHRPGRPGRAGQPLLRSARGTTPGNTSLRCGEGDGRDRVGGSPGCRLRSQGRPAHGPDATNRADRDRRRRNRRARRAAPTRRGRSQA